MTNLVEQVYEYSSLVPEAVVTPKRIAFDWTEEGVTYNAILTSEDGGCSYGGHFGSPKPDKRFSMEASRYDSKSGVILLVVYWRRKDNGNEGYSLVHLATEWK